MNPEEHSAPPEIMPPGHSARLPVVAFVGRPNVGKSTLFNRLVGRRKAIVLDTPGLTRDRIFEEVEWNGRRFVAVDTGGYDPDSKSVMRTAIVEQTNFAIEQADAIVFIVDVRDGLTPSDLEVMDVLRRARKPTILAVNKCDSTLDYQVAFSFAELGIEPLHPISALRGHGVGDLLDDMLAVLPSKEDLAAERTRINAPADAPRIAIVGRQNTGKSTLVNAILGETRVIASAEPGTTRDSIDSVLERNGKPYVVIDTAGIRRRGKIDGSIEKLSVMRAEASMRRADVAVILIDAVEGITEQDAHIAGMAQDAGCAAIIAVNKWDLVEKDNSTSGAWAKALREEWGFLAYAPILFLSGLTGQRVHRIFELVDKAVIEHRKRIDTADLNEWLRVMLEKNPPPTRRGRSLKINYITQASNRPPTFVVFVNDPERMHFSYERQLQNQLRETFGFEGTPLRLIVKAKHKDQTGEERLKSAARRLEASDS